MCFICAIFLKHATVRSQIWERTVYFYHNLYYFFILAGPTSSVSSSPLSSLYLFISSPNCICSLSHFISLLSLSTPHHCLPLRRNPGRSIKPRHATRTQPTLSDCRPPTQPHELDPPHPQQPMAWSSRHATPRHRACRAIHHVIGTSHHRISLNWPAVVGFAFGFVWFAMWVCLIWLCFLPCRTLWLCLMWVLLLGLFDLQCWSL